MATGDSSPDRIAAASSVTVRSCISAIFRTVDAACARGPWRPAVRADHHTGSYSGYAGQVTGNTGPQAPQSPPAPGQEPAVASPRPAVHSRPSMAGMSSDPRVGIWVRRAIMALIAGLVFGIWLNWRLGLTAAAIVVILDTLYQSRAMSPIPAHALAAGAQRRTRRQLSGLRRSGYVTLNARSIPGSDQVIDHLVIGPS